MLFHSLHFMTTFHAFARFKCKYRINSYLRFFFIVVGYLFSLFNRKKKQILVFYIIQGLDFFLGFEIEIFFCLLFKWFHSCNVHGNLHNIRFNSGAIFFFVFVFFSTLTECVLLLNVFFTCIEYRLFYSTFLDLSS